MSGIGSLSLGAGHLPFHQRLSYGVGHVLNDLCASMWFSYLLVFFHSVLDFSNVMAGYVMLVGQVADALSTPLVGYEIDRTHGCCGYTKRKSWHVLGTVCVVATFPFLFLQCITCGEAPAWAKFVYYAPFVVIFQFGWAATQVSHLSLIPELTSVEGERVELNAIRYAFTVLSNMLVYAAAWILLNEAGGTSDLRPHDAGDFRDLALGVVGVGIIFSIVFHIGTKERRMSPLLQDATDDLGLAHGDYGLIMRWNDWLREPQFYQVAVLYMLTRLTVNTAQIYLPLYVLDTLHLNKKFIAVTPLVVYVSGFLGSISMRLVNKCLGRKLTYLIGCALIVGACVWLYFLEKESLEVLGPAVLIGLGGATMLVTSLSITADLIGNHTTSTAFVYGAMSFTDKLSNGIAVIIIQQLQPCKTQSCCSACQWFYRDVMSFVPGGCAVLAALILLSLLPVRLGNLRKFRGRSLEAHHHDEDGEVRVSEGDCCDYMCCFGLIKDPEVKSISRSVSQTASQSASLTGSTENQPPLHSFLPGASRTVPDIVQYEPIAT